MHVIRRNETGLDDGDGEQDRHNGLLGQLKKRDHHFEDGEQSEDGKHDPRVGVFFVLLVGDGLIGHVLRLKVEKFERLKVCNALSQIHNGEDQHPYQIDEVPEQTEHFDGGVVAGPERAFSRS